MVRYLKEKTLSQPNHRGKRALRTIQGLDYLTAMRGLKVVEFYDFDKWLTVRAIETVKDFTFVEDITNQVYRPKDAEAAYLSQWRRLAATVNGFNPSEEFWVVLQTFMESKSPIPEQQWPPQPEGFVPLGPQPIEQVEISSEDDTDDSGVDVDSVSNADSNDGRTDGSDDCADGHDTGGDDNDANDADDEDSGDEDDEQPPGGGLGHGPDTQARQQTQQPTIVIEDEDDEVDAEPQIVGPLPPRFSSAIRQSIAASRSRSVESPLFVGARLSTEAIVERSASAEGSLFVGQPPDQTEDTVMNDVGDEQVHATVDDVQMGYDYEGEVL